MICWLNKGHNNKFFISYERIRGGLLSLIYWHSRSSHTWERETNEPGEHLTVKTPDSSYSDLITSKVDSIHHPQRIYNTNCVTMNISQNIPIALSSQMSCFIDFYEHLCAAAATLLHTFIFVRPWSSNHMILRHERICNKSVKFQMGSTCRYILSNCFDNVY